jgi:hypothetical protein
MPIRAQIPALKAPPIATLKFLDRFDIKAKPEVLIKAADRIWDFGDPEFGIRRNDEKLSGLGNESPTGEFDFFRAGHHKKRRWFAKSHLRNLLRLVTALHTKAALHQIAIRLTITSTQISQELLQISQELPQQMVLFRIRWTPILGNEGQSSRLHGQPFNATPALEPSLLAVSSRLTAVSKLSNFMFMPDQWRRPKLVTRASALLTCGLAKCIKMLVSNSPVHSLPKRDIQLAMSRQCR